jgi:topoisomerase-4 subunit A
VSSKGDYYCSNFDVNNHYEKDILVIEKFDQHKVWTVALWDAEQHFYYLKRFQLESSLKKQSFLGDNAESRLLLMTDVDYPRIEVIFGGNDAYREALVIDADDFIGVKSFKAKGKRLSTFEVETINELEPVRFKTASKEESGNEGEDDDNDPDSEDADKSEQPTGKTPDSGSENDASADDVVDQNRLIDDITGQLTLFD